MRSQKMHILGLPFLKHDSSSVSCIRYCPNGMSIIFHEEQYSSDVLLFKYSAAKVQFALPKNVALGTYDVVMKLSP